MNIQNLSNEELRLTCQRLAREEKVVLAQVVSHIAEVDRRKLYLAWKYASLFEYLTRELGYSESSAYRRMQAARLFREIPDVKDKIESGDLKLNQILSLDKDIKAQEKASGERVTIEDKKEIMEELCSKNQRQTEEILDFHFGSAFQEKIRHRTSSVEMTISLPVDLYDELMRVKELYSHQRPGAGIVDLLKLMVEDVRKKRDPLAEKENVRAQEIEESIPAQSMPQGFCTVKSVPLSVRRLVYRRDGGACVICGSRHRVEVDHITPLFAGGSNDPSNLRLLCKAHNIWRYKQGAGIRAVH